MSKKCTVEVYSRVTGFMRPMQTWNPGKQEEFKDRKQYQGVSNGGEQDNTFNDSEERNGRLT